MDQEKKHDIALMRYSVISPVISGLQENYSSLEAFYRDASSKGVMSPDGTLKHFAPATIKRWYNNYKNGGFDALIPDGRVDEGKPRKLDFELQEQIRYLKQNYPRMSAAAIFRQLHDNGSIKNGEVSESTINRYVNQLATTLKTTTNPDMRRYERPHTNEVWCGDSSVGPYLKVDGKKQRTYIIALIDDASRMIVGIDIFFNDNFVNLMSVIRGAVIKYGKPKKFNFDNGANYRSSQMNLLAARIGTIIHYNPARTPTGKAKIERWFRTLKDQWMSQLCMNDFKDIEELRKSLFAYVQEYNQRIHSSLNGKSPMERFFSESTLIIRMSDQEVERSFLLEIERKVSNDSVIVIDEKEYEVNYKYQGQKLLIRYSPDLKKVYVVDSISKELEPIQLLDKNKNATMHRHKLKLSELGGQ